MKSFIELESIYENQLEQTLILLEKKRKKIKLKYIIAITFIIIPFLKIIFFPDLQSEPKPHLMLVPILLLCVGLVMLLLSIRNKKDYRKEYKETVVREIVTLLNPEWNYSPNMNIWIKDYLMSDLFKIPYHEHKGDDLIWGKIDKTDFQCSEFHTTTSNLILSGKGKGHEKLHTIFKGLFFHADFNKHFKGRTYVAPDTAEKLLGKAGQEFQTFFKDAKLVKLENAEFEKEFVVHSTDQIEARYIITPAIMEAMLNIRKAYQTSVRFSFIGTRVYCALSYNGELFEPKVWRSGVNFDDIKFMHHLFQLNETIIRELNLNTRIWTKE